VQALVAQGLATARHIRFTWTGAMARRGLLQLPRVFRPDIAAGCETDAQVIPSRTGEIDCYRGC
jgi:hypothetical protein